MSGDAGLFELLRDLMPAGLGIAAVVAFLLLANFLLERWIGKVAKLRIRLQLIMLGLSLAGLIVVVLVLPVSESMRGQLLGLFGVLLSAIIALSSTTFVGNAMAGFMLRSVRSFRAGDFVRVGEHFGRVSERGLFHIELQTEDRDLTTLPNLYLVTNPVTVVHADGTVVSATVSLGYDVPRGRVVELLKEAAAEAGLEEPFVQILELGDFSVTYRAAGLLTEVKQIISTKSRLRESMLDHLHGAGVEIVSPSFMNTRALVEGRVFIPAAEPAKVEGQPDEAPEELIFDKADQAETVEQLEERLGKVEDSGERKQISAQIEALEQEREEKDGERSEG